ncbi:MAG: suppressor of fused domain protein [Myxococcales bacterium]|nr:suppressor of fused domain protein [Myxococcales bacterium]
MSHSSASARECDLCPSRGPGWDALADHLAAIYGDAPARYYVSDATLAQGGTDALDVIAVYAAEEGAPHWHLVSFGLSELDEKVFNKPEISGFGLELSLRVMREADDERPPAWALELMQTLGCYVALTGRPHEPGQHLPLGPLDPERDSELTAVIFAEDRVLGELDTPLGHLRYIQIVGITADERELCDAWDGEAFLDVLLGQEPMLLTDLARPSLLADPVRAAALWARAEAEGSSSEGAFVEDLAWEPAEELTLRIGALFLPALLRGLRHRLPQGRDFVLTTPNGRLRLAPGAVFGFDGSEDDLVLFLSGAEARALADELTPRQGSYGCDAVPRLTVVVEATEIRDDDGEIHEVIG